MRTGGCHRSAYFDQFEKGSLLLDAGNLEPFIDKDLLSSIQPIEFRVPSGSKAWGYKAESSIESISSVIGSALLPLLSVG